MKKISQNISMLVMAFGLIGLSSTAHAACTGPAGVEGEQIYNEDNNVMQYCDGTDWTAMRGTLASLSCTDGQVVKWNNTATAWECGADLSGGGGGGDADTLDTLDSLQFLRSDVGDVADGNLTFRGANVFQTHTNDQDFIVQDTDKGSVSGVIWYDHSAGRVSLGNTGGSGANAEVRIRGNMENQGTIDMSTNKIIDMGDPTDAQDAATKAYVDTAISGVAGDDLGSGGTTTGSLFSTNASRTIGRDTNDFIRFDDNAQAFWQINGQWEYQFFPTNFSPYVTNDKDLGTATKTWKNAHVGGAVALGATGTITSSAGTIRDAAGGWIRTYGNTGWYNGTHGGGWQMSDSTWINAYGGKSVISSAVMRADGGFQVDGIEVISGTGFVPGARIVTGSITATQLGSNSVGAAEIAANAVGASEIQNGSVVATTELSATGTKNATTFLRGDNTWATPTGGAGCSGGREHMQIYSIPGSSCGVGSTVTPGIGQCQNGTNVTINNSTCVSGGGK